MYRKKDRKAICFMMFGVLALSALDVQAADRSPLEQEREAFREQTQILDARYWNLEGNILSVKDPEILSVELVQNESGRYVLQATSHQAGKTEVHMQDGDADNYVIVEVKADGSLEENEYVPWTGWNQLDGELSYHVQGVPLTGWQKPTGRSWYHFDENGDADTGWYQDMKDNGTWYYLSPDAGDYGVMKTGWIVDETGWKTYYLDSNGRMLSSQWVNADGDNAAGKLSGPYYLQSDGAVRVNGWAESPMPGVYWFLRAGDGWFNQWDRNCWSSIPY